MHQLLKLTLMLAVLLMMIAPAYAQDEPAPIGQITEEVLERGYLNCGVTNDLPGFGFQTEDGEYVGFDIDFCRAIAAALFGNANAVEFLYLTPAERAVALQDRTIDMLSRNSTWTFSRDTGGEWNAIFAPTTFYDGQGVMVFADSGIRTLEDLAGNVTCTSAGTTTELNFEDVMTRRGLDYDLQLYDETGVAFDALLSGSCDALTTDRSGLAAFRSTAPDPDALLILSVVLSREPLGPASSQIDPQFADIIRWTIYGMIQAEELGITSENIDEFLNSNNPSIQRLLGINDTPSGSYLNIPNDFMVAVISQIGNYEEVFERHLGAETPLGLERGLNALWNEGGLLYAPPFR